MECKYLVNINATRGLDVTVFPEEDGHVSEEALFVWALSVLAHVQHVLARPTTMAPRNAVQEGQEAVADGWGQLLGQPKVQQDQLQLGAQVCLIHCVTPLNL